jgi:hypothetical protein
MGLPEQLREIVQRLDSYGYTLREESAGRVWTLTFPPGHEGGIPEIGFHERDLGVGLRRVLRHEEEQRGVFHRYEQNDARWRRLVYGNLPGDTTIGEAGCGPTSLAIVLQYLMNNGSRALDACYAVSPPETARYAATHGRRPQPRGGTDADVMIRGLQEQWPEFEGSRVTLDEAALLLEEGRLVIFLCRGCRGWSRNRPLHRNPDVTYAGHFMVLAGVEGRPGPDQLFYVADPGRRESRAMRFITRGELERHGAGAGFWWVYRRGEPASRVSGVG